MPTMFLPQNIQNNYNVYLAFYGLLQKYNHINCTILCPGLGTGVGCMTNQSSAYQIFKAIDDYKANNPLL